MKSTSVLQNWQKAKIILLWVIGLLVLATPTARAETTINDITLGDLLMGEAITVEDLKDHVVAVEFTGLN